MTSSVPHIERLLATARGYDALFMAAGSVEDACDENPENLTSHGVHLLLKTLSDDQFENRRTALFFYHRFARILTHTAQRQGPEHPVSRMALQGITALASQTTGSRHLAICSACKLFVPQPGSLLPPRDLLPPLTPISCHALLMEAGLPEESPWTLSGRSLRYQHQQKVLVIKCARPGEDPKGLAQEWYWMQTLNAAPINAGHIPTPLGAPLLQVQGLPEEAASTTAIAFVTTPAYFRYPNEPTAPMETARAIDVIGQAASLFGHLASHGVMHTAPVPLFHNRVQVSRREDEGLYIWEKGGRLDRWLVSCRYPNFGLSGLRDFEHLVPAASMRQGAVYQNMGNQILSLLLVAGSHFRSLSGAEALLPQTTGQDHRPLFDIEAVETMITAILNGYYQGYTHTQAPFPGTAKKKALAKRMVEEMGINHHMDELLRARDQEEMNAEAFEHFLMDRGYSQERARSTPKGAADIRLLTGPHLGPFNGKISCPELIECTATLASLAMSHGFLNHAVIKSPGSESTPINKTGK